VPKNPEKYIQPLDETMNNKEYPFFRSSWEFAFGKYLDESDNVVKWSSEAFPIMYLSPKDNKTHRYFCDFFFQTKNGSKFLVEIKPHAQINNPINQAKWLAAKEYVQKINAQFLVITEKELKHWHLI
jgi:hypothetical protein